MNYTQEIMMKILSSSIHKKKFELSECEDVEKIDFKTLKEQLKVKRGTISSPLEEKLTTTSLEKLNELTLNIFNINSEEDVLKIIH